MISKLAYPTRLGPPCFPVKVWPHLQGSRGLREAPDSGAGGGLETVAYSEGLRLSLLFH